MPGAALDREVAGGSLPQPMLSLFDEQFVRSNDLIQEYVARQALAVFVSSGLAAACESEASVQDAMKRAGLRDEIARVPTTWLCEVLAHRGWLQRAPRGDGVPGYRVATPLPHLECQQIADVQEQHDARALPSYRIVALAAELYGPVLRGEISGEEALFCRENVSAWFHYFSNANPLYAVNNAIHAMTVADALADRAGAMLELGAGLGSAAEAVSAMISTDPGLVARLERYCVTDISPQFIRRAKESLAGHARLLPIAFGWLDINEAFGAQGIAPGSYDIVHGVNVLHVAGDMTHTLAEIHRALRDDGLLVITECIRPHAGLPLYVEFVFNLLESFRAPKKLEEWRPNGGFLTPENWTAAFRANGFRDVAMVPDIARIRDSHPDMVVAAITARRA
jgi:pyochelin synthetase